MKEENGLSGWGEGMEGRKRGRVGGSEGGGEREGGEGRGRVLAVGLT